MNIILNNCHEKAKQLIKDHFHRNDETNECLICFEFDCSNENKPTRFRNHKSFKKTCYCDAYFHNKCLNMWLDVESSCPICRKIVIKLSSDYPVHNSFQYKIFANKNKIILILHYAYLLMMTYFYSRIYFQIYIIYISPQLL